MESVTIRPSHYSALRWEERKGNQAILYCQRGKQSLEAGCMDWDFQENTANLEGLGSKKHFIAKACFDLPETTRQAPFLPCYLMNLGPSGLGYVVFGASSAALTGIALSCLLTCLPTAWPSCQMAAK